MNAPAATSTLTLRELVDLYIDHAKVYYRRRHENAPTREHLNCSTALEKFARYAGENNAATRMTRHQVRAWMDQLVAEDLSRSYVNACLSRVRRFVRWAVDLDYLPSTILAEVSTVRPLPAHRSRAREPEPRKPAVLEHARLAFPLLPPHARDVCQLLMLTGARRGEILRARSRDVSNDVHGARLCPRQHKTAHHNKTRIIPLTPEAMKIVERYWRPLCPDDPLFSAPRSRRRTCYSADALLRAIKRACAKAGVPAFTPHQLRHAVARAVRQSHGLDAASALLGHSSTAMTAHYAPLTVEDAPAVFAQARKAAEDLTA